MRRHSRRGGTELIDGGDGCRTSSVLARAGRNVVSKIKVPEDYAQRHYACARWNERCAGGVRDIGCCRVAGTMGFGGSCWDERKGNWIAGVGGGAGGEELVV
jgi:hypothetical protein